MRDGPQMRDGPSRGMPEFSGPRSQQRDGPSMRQMPSGPSSSRGQMRQGPSPRLQEPQGPRSQSIERRPSEIERPERPSFDRPQRSAP